MDKRGHVPPFIYFLYTLLFCNGETKYSQKSHPKGGDIMLNLSDPIIAERIRKRFEYLDKNPNITEQTQKVISTELQEEVDNYFDQLSYERTFLSA